MGMQVPGAVALEDGSASTISGRPSVVIVGPPTVGKHSILKRLVAKEELLKDDSSSDSTCHGWTIDTKYYTADVCIWTARLDALVSKDNGPPPLEHCEALLMVFDLSDATTFEKLQQWVEASDLTPYEVQMCVGNKADRLPSHFGHVEYRRRLMKRGESSSDPHPEFMDFGIDRTEGSGLLAEEEDDDDPELRKRACIEWCTERGIEYIEACAINEAFDKCMSIDGDLQGVPRILDALSAHMWPGLVMKSTQKLTDIRPDSKENDEDGESSSEDEEDFLIEYEVLSNASTEPWDGNEDLWSFRGTDAPPLDVVPSSGEYKAADSVVSATTQTNVLGDHQDKSADASSSTSTVSHVATTTEDSGDQIIVVQHSDVVERLETTTSVDVTETVEISSLEVTEKIILKNNKEHGAEDLEKMMHEMAGMRENMRNMSDGQRREMAAQLAMRMASMFMDDDEEDDE